MKDKESGATGLFENESLSLSLLIVVMNILKLISISTCPTHSSPSSMIYHNLIQRLLRDGPRSSSNNNPTLSLFFLTVDDYVG